METTVTAFNRPLNDEERSLLLNMATRCIADQTGATHEHASDELGRFVDEGQLLIQADAEIVRVFAAGHQIVDVARDFLAFHASNPGLDPMASARSDGD
jgi:hypothetical protein